MKKYKVSRTVYRIEAEVMIIEVEAEDEDSALEKSHTIDFFDPDTPVITGPHYEYVDSSGFDLFNERYTDEYTIEGEITDETE